MQPVSHTMLDTILRCEKRYEYRYIRGYARRVQAARIELGSWVHRLLAAYWRSLQTGGDYTDAMKAEHQAVLNEWWNPLFEEQQEALGPDMPDKAIGIASRYAARYAEQDRNQWKKILAVEQMITVQPKWLARPLTIKCDAITLDNLGFVWVIEHKVVGTIPDQDNRAADTQGPRYIIGIQEWLLQRGLRVKGIGVIYDYVRDRLPAVPKVNKDGSLSKAWIDTEYDTYLAAIQEAGLDPADYQEILNRIQVEGKPYFERWAVPKSPARVKQEALNLREIVDRRMQPQRMHIRTLDRNRCPWDCEFFPLCLVELDGGDIGPLLQDQYEVRKEEQEDVSHESVGSA